MINVITGYPCDKRNYTSGRSANVRYIVIHYVGATGSGKNNAKYFAQNYTGTSANYFVGHASEGATIYRSVSELDTAWHCGRTDGKYKHPYCRNSNSIGIELCCHKDKNGKWYFDQETIAAAAALTKDIMKRYNIPSNNILRHYDVTGKSCPLPFVEDYSSWSAFRAQLKDQPVQKEDPEMTVYNKLGDVPKSYQPAIRYLMEKGALVGYSNPDPNSIDDNIINVSEDYCRVMTTLYNLGKL